MYEKLKLFSGVNVNASKVKVPRFYPPICFVFFFYHMNIVSSAHLSVRSHIPVPIGQI